jgi:hypothetical protein
VEAVEQEGQFLCKFEHPIRQETLDTSSRFSHLCL